MCRKQAHAHALIPLLSTIPARESPCDSLSHSYALFALEGLLRLPESKYRVGLDAAT